MMVRNAALVAAQATSAGRFKHVFLPHFTAPNRGVANVFANGAGHLLRSAPNPEYKPCSDYGISPA